MWGVRLLLAHWVTLYIFFALLEKRNRPLSLFSDWFGWSVALMGAILSACFTGFDAWWVPCMMFILNGLVLYWRYRRTVRTWHLFVELVLGVLWVVLLGALKFKNELHPVYWIKTYSLVPAFWKIALAIMWLCIPAGQFIELLTRSFRIQISNHSEQSLKNAGTWIGILERLIIFFLVLIGQYEAIGLLVAAKSIIRLKEGDQKMSEYVLIGTLMSISMAILCGFLVLKWV